MATVLTAPEQKVILHNISWETYERLLDERGDHSVPRFNFDQGDLEIMSPSSEHEEFKCAFAQIVDVVVEELDINSRKLGSTTFKREDIERGFEPDACFYIQSYTRMRGRRRIDMLVDPPPDLVIEIDVTSDSMKKLGLYAAFGVPEAWRYDGTRLTILDLSGGHYVERDTSLALPLLTAVGLTQLLEESKSLEPMPWLRKLRKWVREQSPQE